MPNTPQKSTDFAVCINNADYPASLEPHKIYRIIPDAEAEFDGDVRIIDEGGEDYLYSADLFVLTALPLDVERAILETT